MSRMGAHFWLAALASAGLLFVAVGLAGCSSDQIHEYRAQSDKVTAGAGDAMASNRAIHTIDPWPHSSQKTEIDIDGKRAQTAVRRYESNTTAKKP